MDIKWMSKFLWMYRCRILLGTLLSTQEIFMLNGTHVAYIIISMCQLNMAFTTNTNKGTLKRIKKTILQYCNNNWWQLNCLQNEFVASLSSQMLFVLTCHL